MVGKYWQGGFPLSGTFWVGWAVPFTVTCALFGNGGWWMINNVGLLPFYGLVAALLIYLLLAVVPVWRASGAFEGARFYRYAARSLVLLGAGLPLLIIVSIVGALIASRFGLDDTHDPQRTAERMAVPSPSHPMAGFWKSDCGDDFGLAIAPADGAAYSVSFCGPGGCFKPGSYRPNTNLIDDGNYQIVDANTLRVSGRDGWSTYFRSVSREGAECSQQHQRGQYPSIQSR